MRIATRKDSPRNVHTPMFFKIYALFLAAIILGGVLVTPSHAHKLQVEPVVVILRPQKSFLTVEMKGNGEDIIQAVAVRDGERVGNQGLKASVTPRVEKYIDHRLVLQQGGQVLHGKITTLDYWRPDELGYSTSKFRAIMRYERPVAVAGQPLKATNHLFDYLPNARLILSVGGVQKTLTAGETVEFDPTHVTANLWNNVRDFAVLGIEHIFTGPDHVLFILALLVAASSFGPLVKTLSGFTLAHSITLCLAALGAVTPPDRAIELLVAASIVYVGLENIWVKDFKHRFYVASGFGLVHGFGFAGILREIGLPEEGLIWSLLSFNLGVEIGQIIICALAFPVVLQIRKKLEREAQYGGVGWPRAMQAVSWAVVAAGSYWFVERLFS